jgi:hypothetical protein
MDMDFPHSELASSELRPRRDHRALLAQAISRQAASATARALMRAATHDPVSASDPEQILRARINYFANQKGRITGASFLPAACIKVEREDEIRVYQSALANGKAYSLNTTEPVNGSPFEVSRTA